MASDFVSHAAASAFSRLRFGVVCHWLCQCLHWIRSPSTALAEPVPPQFLDLNVH
jgi:hypothetical protein